VGPPDTHPVARATIPQPPGWAQAGARRARQVFHAAHQQARFASGGGGRGRPTCVEDTFCGPPRTSAVPQLLDNQGRRAWARDDPATHPPPVHRWPRVLASGSSHSPGCAPARWGNRRPRRLPSCSECWAGSQAGVFVIAASAGGFGHRRPLRTAASWRRSAAAGGTANDQALLRVPPRLSPLVCLPQKLWPVQLFLHSP